MEITIKKVELNEVAETILTIVHQTFIREFDPPTESTDSVKDYLQSCEVYMVHEDGVPIGYFGYHQKQDKTVELKSIALLPTYQNKGIGKQMMQKIFELTAGNMIWLVVHPKNTNAVITYLKNGFVISSWKEDFFGDRQPRLVMERK